MNTIDCNDRRHSGRQPPQLANDACRVQSMERVVVCHIKEHPWGHREHKTHGEHVTEMRCCDVGAYRKASIAEETIGRAQRNVAFNNIINPMLDHRGKKEKNCVPDAASFSRV